jgi:hypothetical protein
MEETKPKIDIKQVRKDRETIIKGNKIVKK